MDITKAVAAYVTQNQIPIKTISEATEISYQRLRLSLSPNGKRKLSADEFLRICVHLQVDPHVFEEGT